jgi:ubiquinone/menaquinone biosynthesis C-methylase UbiE
MPDVKWTYPGLPFILGVIPKEMCSLVDIGCGRGIIGALCRIYREPTRLVGVDVYAPYLEFCKKYKFYDEYVQWDIEKLPLPFKENEFEVATCIEVIEHLPKNSGEELLNELERIARRVIITTPTSFFEQAEYDQNTHQRHISLWRVGDFRKRNYKIYGVGKLIVRGRTLRCISTALESITRYIPSLSSLQLCIKDV